MPPGSRRRAVSARRFATSLAMATAMALAARPAGASDVVEEAVGVIARRHLMRPDPASLDRQTPAALLASLRRVDPAAQWWPPDIAAANRDWTGEGILGIGASVIEDGDRVLLVPLPGGALARQGVPEPVRLLALAGRSVERLGPEGVQRILRDPDQGAVEARVQDLVGGPPATLSLRRSRYDAVSAERIEAHGASILRVHRFVKGLTVRQLRQALQPVLAAGRPVVLDLRYSVGGELFEALDAASLFVPQGTPLVTLEDATGRHTAVKAVGAGPAAAGPIAVLVGPATASASEIFAAVLRDRAGARLIGAPTFGKCLSQTAFPLADGSVLLISTGRVLTGPDRSCDGQGLRPDVQVDRAEADNTASLLARVGR